ncbi:hypothetical protein MM326_02905 [Alkalihalobacillus sp. LMS6]|uniref:hypothetical protein n=1 Tax=Bacillaceae TaxID=186817 RepID=UPI000C0681B8|nr:MULTISPECIES: hypothetical protein [Bacillaceae]UTR06999.1 hypothetical protein MM326_02905 [Alkalihalobacillus sp. LMS6]
MSIYKIITGIVEASLGFPFVGGSVILSLYWTPLLVMLLLHIIGFRISRRANVSTTGHTLGIVTSSLGWIPVVGMTLHIITAFYLLFEGFMGKDHSSV